VTDDELLDEKDLELTERTIDEDCNEKFWEVEETINVEEEEAPKRKVLKDPGQPTAEEYEKHRIDHIPFRSWCPYCVRGRGAGIQHRRSTEKGTIPVFGFDYFMGKEVTGEESDDALKIIAAKCQLTRCTFAHGVPQKGLDPKLYAVERMKKYILWLGHNKFILKSDNKPAILASLRKIQKL